MVCFVCVSVSGRTDVRAKKKPTKPNMLICFSEPIEVRTLSRSPTYAHIQLISKPKPKLKLKSKPKPTKQYRISPLTRLTVARTSRKRAKLWKTFGWKKRLAVRRWYCWYWCCCCCNAQAMLICDLCFSLARSLFVRYVFHSLYVRLYVVCCMLDVCGVLCTFNGAVCIPTNFYSDIFAFQLSLPISTY